MAVTLGRNQYGKAETRVVRVTRDGGRHQLNDVNVGVTLSGDSANVLPTDAQKNTVHAFARWRHGTLDVDWARSFAEPRWPLL